MPKYKLYMGKRFVASTNILDVALEWVVQRKGNLFVIA